MMDLSLFSHMLQTAFHLRVAHLEKNIVVALRRAETWEKHRHGDLLVHNFIYDVGNLYTNIKHHQGYPSRKSRGLCLHLWKPQTARVAPTKGSNTQNQITFHRITPRNEVSFFSSLLRAAFPWIRFVLILVE